MDTLTIFYRGNVCQIENNKKGETQSTGFKPFCWDIICKSHGLQLVDMLVFIAESRTLGIIIGIDDVTLFIGR